MYVFLLLSMVCVQVVEMLLSLLEAADDPVTLAMKTLRKTKKALRQVRVCALSLRCVV